MSVNYLKFIKWLLPFTCVICGSRSQRPQDLCLGCLKDLPILPHPCPQCALPLPTVSDYPCGQCQKHQPAFAKTYGLFLYQQPLTQLLLGLKFYNQLAHARIFGELLADRIRSHWYQDQPLPECIIPMPLHAQRLQERGFNQALEIARPIQKLLGIPIEYKGIERCKNTAHQMHLSLHERQKNIRRAFQINPSLKGKMVAVLDDVITTGFTMREFCLALKRAGAETIHVWCVARTAEFQQNSYTLRKQSAKLAQLHNQI